MAGPGRPERDRTAGSFRQLKRFHHVINSDKVFGTHRHLGLGNGFIQFRDFLRLAIALSELALKPAEFVKQTVHRGLSRRLPGLRVQHLAKAFPNPSVPTLQLKLRPRVAVTNVGANGDSRIEIGTRSSELFRQLQLDGKPALIFASHLANWELPALAAVAHGLDTAILYRRPNIAAADRIIQDMRAVKMGALIPAGRDAPLRLAEALKNGQHVGMLVDQYVTNGVEVTFFGRKTRANPMLARLLRQIECPVHGVRIVRLPGNRFRGELSEEVKPVRDAAGQIDIQGTMQAVTSVIEGWIREYPDQWLWLHRRWR
jgi:Bacterial lipid A biosynthesis acyltransferase